ncbi:MAG: NUDIX domain-containing protein [Bdellovibrionales bacterium]
MSSIPEFGQPRPGVRYVERPGAYAFLPHPEDGRLAIVKTAHGLFLPGGGLNRGEEPVAGLKREIFEEIGYQLLEARLVARANQYHWSEFYREHFKKTGMFYLITARAPSRDQCSAGHELLWLPAPVAQRELTQEFQRWATETWRGR